MTELAFQPDWFSKPGDTIAAIMAQQNVGRAELASKLELNLEVFRDVLRGLASVDDAIADKLAQSLGGTSAFWKKRQEEYDAALTSAAMKISSADRSHWLGELASAAEIFAKIERTRDDTAKIKSYMAYFGVSTPTEWQARYTRFEGDVSFRTSATFESSIGSLSCWLRQAEIDAATLQTNKWCSKALRDTLPSLRRLSRKNRPADFIPTIRNLCASVGVAVSFVKAPKGCRASGATKFLSPNTALIVLSFRYLSDDQFWFTFFHEIGHLLLHSCDTVFVDGDESQKTERGWPMTIWLLLRLYANLFNGNTTSASSGSCPLSRHLATH